MQTDPVYYEDEIDLRELIVTLLQGWKVILFLVVLCGSVAYGYSALQQPVYEASASLLIDQQSLSMSSSPISLLQSENIRQLVAESLTVDENLLPTPSVTADKTDKTLFTLTVQSTSAKEAASVANAWADASIVWILDEAQAKETLVDQAEADLQEADRAFVAYLEKHGLNAWTWAELSLLTGVSNYQMEGSRFNELPSINDTERLEIAELMRKRIAKESYYFRLLADVRGSETGLLLNPPTVLSYANIRLSPINKKPLQNTALGLVLGFILGIFFVFAAAWWRNAQEER